MWQYKQKISKMEFDLRNNLSKVPKCNQKCLQKTFVRNEKYPDFEIFSENISNKNYYERVKSMKINYIIILEVQQIAFVVLIYCLSA